MKKQAEDSWKSGGIGYADNQLPLLLQCCHVNVSVYNRYIPRCRASAAASLGRQAESILFPFLFPVARVLSARK